MSAGSESAVISCTVSGDKIRTPPSSPPFSSIWQKRDSRGPSTRAHRRRKKALVTARRITRSNQRPDTLMLDRKAARSAKPLAAHGRTIHPGYLRPSCTLTADATYPPTAAVSGGCRGRQHRPQPDSCTAGNGVMIGCRPTPRRHGRRAARSHTPSDAGRRTDEGTRALNATARSPGRSVRAARAGKKDAAKPGRERAISAP